MVIAIAGAHGKIATALTDLLLARGDTVIGLIRNPDHATEVSERGAAPVVCDLESASVDEVARAISGADGVVFAAGAGPGSGAVRKMSMDRDGAIKLLEAAKEVGAGRYLIVSAVGAENPPSGDEVFDVYLQAKAQADEAVQRSDRDWTIVRPGRLTDDPGTGRVRIESTPFRGQVSREDVAATLLGLLEDPRATRRLLYVNGGEQPVEQALEEVLGTQS
ncbi:MAG: SDR family oxidoreductase [Solirubrobacterales bacterium]|nr:SDR family oxidoreductase [Solirubrobacterales bacterium]